MAKVKSPIYKETIKRMDMQSSLDLPEEQAKRFKADITGGNLFISRSSQSNKAYLEVQWKEGCPSNLLPKFTYDSVNGLIELKAQGFKHFIGQREAYLIHVYLPKDTPIEVTMAAGVIYINKMEGSLKASLMAGEILGYSHTCFITAHVGAGSIKLYGIHGGNNIQNARVEAVAKLGDVELAFDNLKANDNIKASSWAGDVKFLLPPGLLHECTELAEKNYIKAKDGLISNNVRAIIRGNTILGDTKAYINIIPEVHTSADKKKGISHTYHGKKRYKKNKYINDVSAQEENCQSTIGYTVNPFNTLQADLPLENHNLMICPAQEYTPSIFTITRENAATRPTPQTIAIAATMLSAYPEATLILGLTIVLYFNRNQVQRIIEKTGHFTSQFIKAGIALGTNTYQTANKFRLWSSTANPELANVDTPTITSSNKITQPNK